MTWMAAVAVVVPVTAVAAVLGLVSVSGTLLVGVSVALQAMLLDAVLEVLWLAALEDVQVEEGGCTGWAEFYSILVLYLSAVARCLH